MEIKGPLARSWAVPPAATGHMGSLGRLYKSGWPGVHSPFNKAGDSRRGAGQRLWDGMRDTAWRRGEERGPVLETQLCGLAGGCYNSFTYPLCPAVSSSKNGASQDWRTGLMRECAGGTQQSAGSTGNPSIRPLTRSRCTFHPHSLRTERQHVPAPRRELVRFLGYLRGFPLGLGG